MEAAIQAMVKVFLKSSKGKESLGKKEFQELVKSQLSNILSDTDSKDAINNMGQELDANQDGRVGFEEYMKLVGYMACSLSEQRALATEEPAQNAASGQVAQSAPDKEEEKPEANAEPKPEASAEPKAEATAEVKVEANADPKVEVKVEAKAKEETEPEAMKVAIPGAAASVEIPGASVEIPGAAAAAGAVEAAAAEAAASVEVVVKEGEKETEKLGEAAEKLVAAVGEEVEKKIEEATS